MYYLVGVCLMVPVAWGEVSKKKMYREDASFRLDPSMEAALGCRLLPLYECWTKETLLETTLALSAGDCCGMCGAREDCAAYNWRHASLECELLGAGAEREVDDETGCAGGSSGKGASTSVHPSTRPQKNVIFLVVESTDGRTWTPGYQKDVVSLPNIRRLQEQGATFTRLYSNAPVCCPSRATFWSGRHAHEIPHLSAVGGFLVQGVWNNYEGLPTNYTGRLDQVLYDAGYAVLTNGKTDWATGGHSENVYLDAWTKYVDFPYDIPAIGGWYTEDLDMCGGYGTVSEGNASAHQEDWDAAREAVAWASNQSGPFFLYTGFKIVHPPYATNEYWNSTIDRSKIEVPEWPDLNELHPCDFQQTMRKGCAPSDANASVFYSIDRRREIRAKYMAMIAEFDAMVGLYVDAFFMNRGENDDGTVFVVTSDHGDMQMEHQQFYKMAPYDASASVPMVIAPFPQKKTVAVPTQLIDIAPTVLDLLDLPADPRHQGASLRPLLVGESDAVPWTRDFVVTQFHGDDLAMSWFAVVAALQDHNATYKLVVWGDGRVHPPLLFDLDADPDEATDLYAQADPDLLRQLDQRLRSVVDYRAVAHDVARYAHRSLEAWIDQQDDWQAEIHKKGLRWDVPFDAGGNATFLAIDAFRTQVDLARLRPCRNVSTFPGARPSSSSSHLSSSSSSSSD